MIHFTVPTKGVTKKIMTNDDYTIDLLQVISDFLEMGHVENIVAMYRQDTGLYALAGELVRDERFAVRLGAAVLFEELAVVQPNATPLAIPSLLPLLQEENPLLRGEAATILGIIGTPAALQHLLRFQDDPDPGVREIITDILRDMKEDSGFPTANEEST